MAHDARGFALSVMIKKKYQSIFIVGQCTYFIIFTNRSLVGYGSHFILISTVYVPVKNFGK